MAEPTKQPEPPAVKPPAEDSALAQRVAVCEAALRQMNPGHFEGEQATYPAPEGRTLAQRVDQLEKALELMAPGNLRLARERLAQGK
jgi:hypothetical protein